MNLQRLKCRVLGCNAGDGYPFPCLRCGEPLFYYEGNSGGFCEGIFAKLRRCFSLESARRRIKNRFFRRCVICNTRLSFRLSKRHGWFGACCSKKCNDADIPF